MATQALLDEAWAAYHRLATGGNVVEARDRKGGLVRYDQASIAELRRYINLLQTELGVALTNWTPQPRTASRRVLF